MSNLGFYLSDRLTQAARRKVMTAQSFSEVLSDCPYRSARSRYIWIRLTAVMWALHHNVPMAPLTNSKLYRKELRAYRNYLEDRAMFVNNINL